jgi:beta-glucosidase
MARATEASQPLAPDHRPGVDPSKAAAPAQQSWLKRHFPFLRTRRGIIITVIVILVIIGGGLAGLAALPKKNSSNDGSTAGGASADTITDDGHFYGQSPPVYPSRMPFQPLPDG